MPHCRGPICFSDEQGRPCVCSCVGCTTFDDGAALRSQVATLTAELAGLTEESVQDLPLDAAIGEHRVLAVKQVKQTITPSERARLGLLRLHMDAIEALDRVDALTADLAEKTAALGKALDSIAMWSVRSANYQLALKRIVDSGSGTFRDIARAALKSPPEEG